MNGYQIPDDGLLHVNYSSLKRCTSPKGVVSVIREQRSERLPFENEGMRLGKVRHRLWQRESESTGRTPADFKNDFSARVDFVEQSFAATIFDGVMLHFRPDAVSIRQEAVIDYKKVVKGAHQFLNDKQLIIYAYGLQLHGYRIRRAVHLCEVWNDESTAILGYQALVRDLKLSDIALAPRWLKARANYLVKAQRLLT